jgi:hypothetical protein
MGWSLEKRFGEEAIMEYNHKLAIRAGVIISHIWDTDVLINDSSKIGAMVNIRISSIDGDKIKKAQEKTLFKNNCYVVFFKFEGKYYTRISAQIYNEENDYITAAKLFLDNLNNT